jgi:hypothetical protein
MLYRIPSLNKSYSTNYEICNFISKCLKYNSNTLYAIFRCKFQTMIPAGSDHGPLWCHSPQFDELLLCVTST